MGCSPSGTGCSNVDPLWGHKPCQQTCSGMGSSLHSSIGPSRSLLQCGLSMGSQPRSHTFTCSTVGSSLGYRWISAPSWASMGCRRTACLTIVFITGCRGISALVSRAPPPPPSSLTLVSAELFLHIFSLLSLAAVAVAQGFFPPFSNTLPQRRYHHH